MLTPQRASRTSAALILSGAAVGLIVAMAPAATAAPSARASCVAQFVLGPAGPPGQFQRQVREPRFGQVVSSVAKLPREACFDF